MATRLRRVTGPTVSGDSRSGYGVTAVDHAPVLSGAVKAVRVVRNAAPLEAIEVAEVDEPQPGPGEVRVAVAAASLNFGDIARCTGGVAAVMAEPPFTLGMDVCGV